MSVLGVLAEINLAKGHMNPFTETALATKDGKRCRTVGVTVKNNRTVIVHSYLNAGVSLIVDKLIIVIIDDKVCLVADLAFDLAENAIAGKQEQCQAKGGDKSESATYQGELLTMLAEKSFN